MNYDMLEEQMESLNLSTLSSVINKSYGSEDIDIKSLILKAASGDLDISPASVLDFIYSNFFAEVITNFTLIRNLIVIALLSAVLKNLSSSFKEKSVSELGFFVCYIALVTILFTSFQAQAGIIEDLILTLVNLMQAAVPFMMGLVVMSGSVTGAYAVNPIILFGVNILSQLVYSVIIPIITLAAVIQLLNYLADRNILSTFAKLAKDVSSWGLKGIAVIFMASLSLQGVVAPAVNNVIKGTAKAAMKTVPVVGDVLTGAVDIVAVYSSALKSGAMVALIIVAVIMCAIPILKLLAIAMVYKLTAALIQPVCDDRLVKCIDAIGSYIFLMLGAGVAVATMFVFSIIVTLLL